MDQRDVQKRVFELETLKIEATARGNDAGAIEAELEAARTVLQQIKFQRFVVLGEVDAKFPPPKVADKLREERQNNRYWMESHRPKDLPSTYARNTAPVFKRRIEHSITTDYESDKWAMINILLETLQNAEPSDSNGTWFGIEVCISGKWKSWKSFTPRELKKLKNEDVEAVRIVDNGGGYAPTELGIFGSSKDPDSDAAGKFGEGGNMADVTACRIGMEVVKSARNWRAKPCVFKQIATGRTVSQLGYDVEFHDDILPGTEVEFRKFGPEFIEILRGIDDFYLPLRGADFTVLSKTAYGDIVDKKDCNILFVKGRAYPVVPPPDQPFLFSYNLTRFVVQDRNRGRINLHDAISHIHNIWKNNRNRQAVKDLITAHKAGKSCYELTVFGRYVDGAFWDHEAVDLFGEVACEVYEIPDPNKTFSTMGDGYEEAEKFLKEKGGLSALTIGGSRFLTQILQRRFKSTKTIFNSEEIPGALACTPKGDVLEKGSDFFVDAKAMKVGSAFHYPPLFSYNFKDRVSALYSIDESTIQSAVIDVWANIKNERVVMELFTQYNGGQKTYELNQCCSGWSAPHANYPSADLFKKTAYEVFNVTDPQKCFLKSANDSHMDSEMALQEKGYACIDVHESPMLHEFLNRAGILTAEEILEKNIVRKNMDVPMKVAAKNINLENIHVGLWRFMGSCEIEVLVQKSGKDDKKTETWMPYKEWTGGVEGQTTAYRFVGKATKVTKDDLDYDDRGKKAAPCLHSLCSFMKMQGATFTVKSGNLLIRIDESDRWASCYKIQNLGDGGSCNSTALTIFGPSTDFLASLRHMKTQVLDLDPGYKPLERTPSGDLVKTDGGLIFRHGIIEDATEEKNIFLATYCVRSDDENAPSQILENLSDAGVIQKILSGASGESKYADINGMTCLKHPEAWRKAFFAEFGKKTVVADGQNMLAAAVASRFGYQQISFPESLARILVQEAKVPSLSGLACVGEYKEQKNISDNVASLLAFGANVRSWLKEKLEISGAKVGDNLVEWDPAKITIVKQLKNKNGDNLDEFGGFFDTESGRIFIFANRLMELSKGLQAMMRVMNYSLGDVFKDNVQASLYMDNVFSTLMECLVRSGQIRDLLGQSIDKLESEDLEDGLKNLFGSMTTEAKEEKAKREAALSRRIIKQLRKYGKASAKWRADQIKETKKRLLDLSKGVANWPVEQIQKLRDLMVFRQQTESEPKDDVLEQRQPDRIPRIQRNLRTAIFLLMGSGASLLLADRVNMPAIFNNIDFGSFTRLATALPNILPKIDLSGIIPDIDFPDLFKGGDMIYSRPIYKGRHLPGVTARSLAEGITEEMDSPEWMETVFLSTPNYNQWDGFWMSDYEYHQFDGTNWNNDPDAPQFPYQNYPNQLTWMHLQAITSPGQTFIRTASSAIIDVGSIQVLDKDGNLLPYSAKPQEDGMLVNIDADGAKKIIYNTRMAVNFEEAAAKISDADYQTFSSDAYKYYTSTPDIDLSSLPFSWKQMPNVHTWKDFFKELHRLQPYERFKFLYHYVSSREYSDAPETVQAYTEFQLGLLPQKTLIEFLLGSPKLPTIGAGDCDVHNTLFAWALREAGIPAKLDIVMNGEHGIVNAFFPGIGWVVGDAVGKRVEQRSQRQDFRPQTVDVLSAEELQKRQTILLKRQHRNAAINECIKNID
ncbi:transglutaminase domain-containing protein [Candidatus Peregrinibacteria bacterium]|nr:transglutaminase domain-containing protein [Candidatus Peregrinibacteria bacterium]